MPRARKHQDAFFHKAKREGYVARSAYKLIEIDDRRRIFRRGDTVLDLGCAPGSWLQVAAERVGERGRVVGVDLQPVERRNLNVGPNVTAIVADAFEIDPAALLQMAGVPAFDVLLSDMAPKTTGSGDHFLSVRLCERVLELCTPLLKDGGGGPGGGGSLVMKVFEGEQYPDLLRQTAAAFTDVKGFKPKSSRDVSREMFIVARGFKRPARAAAGTEASAEGMGGSAEGMGGSAEGKGEGAGGKGGGAGGKGGGAEGKGGGG